MSRAVVCVLASLIALPIADGKELPAAFKKENKRALALYAKESYKDAAAAFRRALAALQDSPNRNAELATRKYLVLALYNSGSKDAAIAEYRALKTVAPAFQLDPDEVLPETIAFLTTAAPDETAPEPPKVVEPTPPSPTVVKEEPPPPPPAEAPASQLTAVPDAPRDVKPAIQADAQPSATKKWHWYYLTPLGIGQYLAGSPVRGTLFLLLQAGFTALNVAGYVLYSRELIYGDGTAKDGRAAQMGQTMMNVGFFGIIGSVVAGTIDGAFLEP